VSDFYNKTKCDRCGAKLNGMSIMSWFVEQTICLDTCQPKEAKIKAALRKQGLDTLEGCGYIPKVKGV